MALPRRSVAPTFRIAIWFTRAQAVCVEPARVRWSHAKGTTMRKILTVTAFAAGLMASPAMAQSAAPGGFHVGVLAGYEGLEVETSDGSLSADADSAVYGINAGYDLSLGGAFVGVEGELSTSDGSARFPDSFAGARDGLKSGGQYYLGGRIGVALTPGIAAYGKVGYTSLDTKAFTSAGNLDEL